MANWKTIEEKWDKLDRVFDKICVVITSTAFLVIVAAISLNVICRYLFGKSFNWAEEIAYLCFNWVVFFGVAIVYRYQGLTAIDLVVNRLAEKPKKVVLVFGYILVTMANLGLIVWGTKFAMMAWERKSSFLQIPYFYYDISIPLAAIMLFMYSLKFLIKAIHGEDVDSAALEDRV